MKKVAILGIVTLMFFTANFINGTAMAKSPPQSMFIIGKEYYMKGDYNNAINYFKMVLAQDPKHFDTLHYMGGALYRLGNYKGAIEYDTKALEIDPQFY